MLSSDYMFIYGVVLFFSFFCSFSALMEHSLSTLFKFGRLAEVFRSLKMSTLSMTCPECSFLFVAPPRAKKVKNHLWCFSTAWNLHYSTRLYPLFFSFSFPLLFRFLLVQVCYLVPEVGYFFLF